ncbi:MAG: SDR family oxidoreductase [Saprospiraceae bacterium]|nr:SDR family oxidoreductase [Saprospiraceae bacterium]
MTKSIIMKNTALITGASSGIGKEFARIHAEKTGDLIIIARRTDKLETLKKELEEQYQREVLVIAKDLSEPNAAWEIFDTVKSKGITVEYLINNAGFGLRGKFHELPLERHLAMINVNITALTALTWYFLPDMVKNNRGRILNVSSTAALVPGPLQAVYYASKSYVTSLSNAIAEELYDTNVTVTALMPGATETEFARTSDMDKTSLFQKTFSAKTVAAEGYQAMMQGKLDIFSGLTGMQKMQSYILPLMPKKVVMPQIRKMQEI